MLRRLVVLLLALAACAGSGQSKADQGRSIAEHAGLSSSVADFFALAAQGANATYRSTLSTTDAEGKPIQLTTTQRPPDVRLDTFHADGSVDSTISVGGHRYQCTMAANHWDCGELGVTASSTGGMFGPAAVQGAVDQFRQRANDYDFRVEDRSIVNLSARCLVTTRKPGHEQNSALAAAATLCVSREGAILEVEVPSGTITATAYTTAIPADAFTLPAATTPASSS